MTQSQHSGCCGHHDHGHSHEQGNELNFKKEIISIIVIILLLGFGLFFKEILEATPYSIGQYLVFIPAYLIAGWSVLITAGKNILRGKIFDENFLMTIATLGAIAINQLPEAVAVMLFYRIGEFVQDLAVGRSRHSIKSLLEIRPDFANLKVDNQIQKVDPKTVSVDQLILVKPGEKVPLDGEIIEGISQVDTSALTGESVPRSIKVGDLVLAGSINKTGVFTLKVTKKFEESSIAKILDLVENASSKKAETEKFITRFAQYYTPVVVFLSLAVAIFPPLLIPNATTEEWIYRALVLLVISCPCGLVISIPLGYFGGVGGAAKRGILVKGSAYLDVLTAVKTVAFDKTGTLTQGVFKVSQIMPNNGWQNQDLLKIAAQIESHSNHPIAQSIQAAYGQPTQNKLLTHYQEIAGHGIIAQLNNQQVLAGNDRLLHREQIEHNTCDVEGTVVHVAVNQNYAGYITISDQIKPDATEAISQLKTVGIEQTVMLTGDDKTVAEKVANTLGLDRYYAELLPEDKVEVMEQLLHKNNKNKKQNKNSKVAFVGDGINDAPVLARADVGIAMGGLGSDAAIETADIVLMTDSPLKIVEAIQIARKTRRIVWQNIFFAMAIKGIFILLGSIGLATLWEAVFADVGVALLAIINATRILR
ncbi:MAG: heavy metal translocating P-type ATPase [Microcoleaceae cyanobacterium]